MYPFKDRPDVGVPVLFYAVPPDRPYVPDTHFRPVWYQAIDGWVRMPDQIGMGTPDIGEPLRTENREWVPAPGHFTVPGLGPLVGSADEWANGVLYSRWQAGAYGPMTNCVAASAGLILADSDYCFARAGTSEGSEGEEADRDWFAADAYTSEGSDVVVYDEDTLTADVASGGDPGLAVEDEDSLECDGSASSPAGPGATCATAGLMTLGTTYTFTVPAFGTHWWYFPTVNGTTYRVRYVYNSGDTTNGATLLHGNCPSPTLVGPLPVAGCQQFTAGASEQGYVQVTGGFMSGTNYSITAAAANCP